MTLQRFFAIRHGETDWNAAGRFQGQTDIPLHEEGRRQVKEAAARLAELSPTGIVTSDLGRAVETAQAIADATGLPFITDMRLREVNLGSWEGLTRVQIAKQFPEEWKLWTDGVDLARGGGESTALVRERVSQSILEHVSTGQLGDRAVVVGHGMALGTTVRWLASTGRVRFPPHDGPLRNAKWFDVEMLPQP